MTGTQDGAKLADELEAALHKCWTAHVHAPYDKAAFQALQKIIEKAETALRRTPAAVAQDRASAKITGVGMDGVRFTAECIHGELKVGQLLYAVAQGTREEPVAIVKRNDAGQVYLTDQDGGVFDVTRHVGKTLYAAPPRGTREQEGDSHEVR